MRYVEARFKKNRRDEIYRIYVTDCLYVIANGGLRVVQRYADIVDPQEPAPKDTRTQEEIVAQVWRGIKGGEET